jgi:tetratricopeptide (TPR) repeat protein
MVDVGQYQEVYAILQSINKQCPDNYQAMELLGYLYEQQGFHEKAIYWYNMSLSRNPYSFDSCSGLARCLAYEGEMDRFYELLEVYNSSFMISYVAWTLHDLGMYDEAKKLYDRLKEPNKSDIEKIAGYTNLSIEELNNRFLLEWPVKLWDPNQYDHFKYHYSVLAEICENTTLVIMQYPLREGSFFNEFFPDTIPIIENKQNFEDAREKYDYDELFIDSFARNIPFGGTETFGHATSLGNRLIAENVAEYILTNYP